MRTAAPMRVLIRLRTQPPLKKRNDTANIVPDMRHVARYGSD